MYPKRIIIDLPDGAMSGIRCAEIVNWNGQAVSCPRRRIPDLNDYPKAKQPGVYFLVGLDEQSTQERLYIGEAENVLHRMADHLQKKDFWNELIFFTSKDDYLTKAHVKYLESRLIAEATEANRYKLENDKPSQAASLPKGERDAMEEFIAHIRILLGVFGHRALDPLVAPVAMRIADVVVQSGHTGGAVGETLKMQIGSIGAEAVRTDEGIVVRAGSLAERNVKPSLPEGTRKLRESLISQGVLTDEGNTLKFVKDWLFSSPSQAAAIVAGYSINGRDYWRIADGRSLRDWEEKAIGASA